VVGRKGEGTAIVCQMKILLTTKIYNFSRSTTFVLVVFPFKIVQKIFIETSPVPSCLFKSILEAARNKTATKNRCIYSVVEKNRRLYKCNFRGHSVWWLL
jgi:hypothetical protein